MDIKNSMFCACFYFLFFLFSYLTYSMKYLKKILAISTIASILIASSITTNAAINNTTATSADGLQNTVITITDSGNEFINTNEITSATIKKLDGTAATATLTPTWTTGDDATSTVTITGADLTIDTSYIIMFTTANGDFGSTTLRVWETTNDTLTVSASVEPMLKFAMESNNKDFGVLTTAYSTVSTGIEVWTNAINWITVTAKSTNWGLISGDAGHLINDTTNDAIYDGEWYQFTSTLWTSDSITGAVLWWLAATDVTNATLGTTNVKTIYTANDPQNFDWSYDTTFTVWAKIAESTPAASDYGDVIIFTATANF